MNVASWPSGPAGASGRRPPSSAWPRMNSPSASPATGATASASPLRGAGPCWPRRSPAARSRRRSRSARARPREPPPPERRGRRPAAEPSRSPARPRPPRAPRSHAVRTNTTCESREPGPQCSGPPADVAERRRARRHPLRERVEPLEALGGHAQRQHPRVRERDVQRVVRRIRLPALVERDPSQHLRQKTTRQRTIGDRGKQETRKRRAVADRSRCPASRRASSADRLEPRRSQRSAAQSLRLGPHGQLAEARWSRSASRTSSTRMRRYPATVKPAARCER